MSLRQQSKHHPTTEDAPPRRPSNTWLKVAEDELKPQNVGLITAHIALYSIGTVQSRCTTVANLKTLLKPTIVHDPSATC